MPLARLREPFDDPDWLFELKWDGFRALAYITREACQLVSRNGNNFASFADLCAGLNVGRHSAVIDGEIVHLGPDGAPRFYDLMRRRGPLYFVAFDLLWLDGRDVRAVPLFERKRLLKPLVSPPMIYGDHVLGTGVELFQRVCERDLEGIVAKLVHGRYEPDATTWVKIKNPRYSQNDGRRELFERKPRAAGA